MPFKNFAFEFGDEHRLNVERMLKHTGFDVDFDDMDNMTIVWYGIKRIMKKIELIELGLNEIARECPVGRAGRVSRIRNLKRKKSCF